MPLILPAEEILRVKYPRNYCKLIQILKFRVECPNSFWKNTNWIEGKGSLFEIL